MRKPACTIRIVTAFSPGRLAQKSTETADLLVASGSPWVARHGVVAIVTPNVRDLAIALLARPGARLTVHDLVERVYAFDEDGGPLDAPAAIRRTIYDLRSLGPALGIRLQAIGYQYEAMLA